MLYSIYQMTLVFHQNFVFCPKVLRICFMYTALSHPGSGSDRTIASVQQVTALVMLYIG